MDINAIESSGDRRRAIPYISDARTERQKILFRCLIPEHRTDQCRAPAPMSVFIVDAHHEVAAPDVRL